MSVNLEVSKRLKKARQYLKLSQNYVGSLLGVEGTTISDIENGKRNVSDCEMKLFSKIYGWSADELFYGDTSKKGIVFARTDENLPDEDKREIMNLIKFKRKLRKNNCELLQKL